MPRPYTDPVEIITAPVPAQSPFIPTDAKIVVGAVAPASPDPIPIVLLPGFEYRMREWRHPDTHDVHWRLERRLAAQPNACGFPDQVRELALLGSQTGSRRR